MSIDELIDRAMREIASAQAGSYPLRHSRAALVRLVREAMELAAQKAEALKIRDENVGKHQPSKWRNAVLSMAADDIRALAASCKDG
jgi:hypothetical protein